MKKPILKYKHGQQILTGMLEGKIEGEITKKLLETTIEKMDTDKLVKLTESIKSKSLKLTNESLADNPIFNDVESSRAVYVHALEVEDVLELQSNIEALIEDLDSQEYNHQDIFDFIYSMEIYALDEENEEEVWDFDIAQFLKDNLDLEETEEEVNEISENVESTEYSDDEYRSIADAMVKYGGSFFENIGRALQRADMENRDKLHKAFEKDFQSYYKLSQR